MIFLEVLLRGTKNQGENITKSTDELLKDLNNKSVSQQVGPSQESLIVEKIGINEHSSELSALKELPRKSYLKNVVPREGQSKKDFLIKFLDQRQIQYDEGLWDEAI